MSTKPIVLGPDPDTQHGRLVYGAALTLLALMAMARLWGHPFVQDDMGVINFNETAHHWSGLWRSFTLPYWPPADSGELYRPLTISWFTTLWMVGDGAVWPFRVASLAIYVALTLVLWRFLRGYTTPSAAWFGAAVFAVHPVHVEAVALAVNQAELLVGLLLVIAVRIRILSARGEIAHRRAAILIWALFAAGVFIKEQALVLPGLLLAADLLLEQGNEARIARLKRWSWHYLLLIATAAIYWTIRSEILGGGPGTRPAEALIGLSMLGRAYTMLGVPAEWLRLLLWPADLQSDWNLMEWVPTQAWSLRETAGVIALGSMALAFALSWRRRPVIAFGIAWMAVTLAPVANVLMPTGIILAERTLLLPSMGVAMIIGDLARPLELQWTAFSRWRRAALATMGAALLLAGAVRSGVRQTAWQTRQLFIATQALDAPTSWRARLAYGLMLSDLGDSASARVEIRNAIAIRPDDRIVARALADVIRLREGKCLGPSIIYEEILAHVPGRSEVRGSLVACYLFLGRYADARAEAERGIAMRLDQGYFRYVVGVADSAAQVAAPIQTVRLRPLRNFTSVGTPVPGVL